MAELHRHFVDKVTDITADQKSGIAKITFGVSGPGGGDVMQMIVPVGYLREMFAQIGEKMQSTFESGGRPGPGGPGGPGPRGPRGAPNTQFKDLTE
jgi:hypothetical protein